MLLVDYEADRNIPFGFTLLDECDFLENPHGSLIDFSQEQRAITQSPYAETVREFNTTSFKKIFLQNLDDFHKNSSVKIQR